MKYVTIHAARKRNFLLWLSLRHTVPLDSACDVHEKPRNRPIYQAPLLTEPQLIESRAICKNPKWQTAKERPLASTIALACQNTPTHHAQHKTEECAQFDIICFPFLPANKNIIGKLLYHFEIWFMG